MMQLHVNLPHCGEAYRTKVRAPMRRKREVAICNRLEKRRTSINSTILNGRA